MLDQWSNESMMIYNYTEIIFPVVAGQTQYTIGPTGDVGSTFVGSISGDILTVGAYGNDDNGSAAGAVYNFYRNEGGQNNWGFVKKLYSSDIEFFDNFGYSVAVDGDTLVVGAQSESEIGFFAGAAYIFEKNQGGADNWGEVMKLTASDAGAEDFFGSSVFGSSAFGSSAFGPSGESSPFALLIASKT